MVEADETVLYGRGIIRYSASIEDEIKDTVWIFEAIDSDNKTNFYIKRAKNRKVDALSKTLSD